MIDIGANLSSQKFVNYSIPELLAEAAESGVTGVVLTSVNALSYLKNLELAESDNSGLILGTTWGVHPHYSNTLDALKVTEIAKNVLAIGETGLDYFRMLQPKEVQQNAFEYLIERANTVRLPLFLHERSAHLDFTSMLKASTTKKVVHCFTGNSDQLKKYLDLDCFIGITGWICDKRRNQDLLQALKYCPVDKLMIETDAPYLKPLKAPGAVNTPSNLKYVAEELGKYYSEENLLKIILKNTKDFWLP